MLVGMIALVLGAAFCGAALYIQVAEHPARMMLDDRNALAQWGPSYARAFNLQGGLAVASGLAGIVAAFLMRDLTWTLGALLMLANWPFTVWGILPLNNRLKAIPPDSAGRESRAMLDRWIWLHAVRTRLSGLAVLAYLWAAAS